MCGCRTCDNHNPDYVETKIYNGKEVKIFIDTCTESPREWDNLGTILYTSKNYTLGDKQVSPDEITEIIARDDIIYLPVYAYIHSGIALNTTGFSCPWDSGKSGIIYCTYNDIKNNFGTLTTETINQAFDCLRAEIKTFSEYCNGEVYILKTDNDSIGGVYHDSIDEIANELTRE